MIENKPWKEENDALVKTFEFKNFKEAMSFMCDATEGIEALKHHPTWSNTYNKLMVSLQTHDAWNKVTEKDTELAQFLDNEYQKLYPVNDKS